MKINTKNNKPLETNTDVKDAMKFTLKNPGKIMTVFRDNMYKHKFRTMVQEYMCNARDGVREKLFMELRATNKIAGKDISNLAKIEELYNKLENHVEVWAPTSLNLFFRVRDYGVGISPERMRDVFLDFGSSTKNENYSTGGFGFGGKIGFAVSDSFSITSWYNGIKYEYLATLLNDPDGELIELSKSPTAEPNGVMIEVPIGSDNINIVNNAIVRTCLFWKNKPVIHNISDLSNDWYKFEFTYKNGNGGIVSFNNDNLEFGHIKEKIINSKNDRFFILIDDIIYPINNGLLLTEGGIKITALLRENQAVLLKANVGVLDIIANREEIAINDTNEALINEMFHQMANDFTIFLYDKVNNAKDFWEAMKKHQFLNTHSLLMKLRRTDKTNRYVASNYISFIVDDKASRIKIMDMFSSVVFKKESMRNDLGYCVTKRSGFEAELKDLSVEVLNKIKFYTNKNKYTESKVRSIATNLIRHQNVAIVVILRDDIDYVSFFNAIDVADVILVKESNDIAIERKKPRKLLIKYVPVLVKHNVLSTTRQAQLADFRDDELIIYLDEKNKQIHHKGTDLLLRSLICDVLNQNQYKMSFVLIADSLSLNRVSNDKRFIKAMDFLNNIEDYANFEYIEKCEVSRLIKEKICDANFNTTKNIDMLGELSNKDLQKYTKLMNELNAEISELLVDVKVIQYEYFKFWLEHLNKIGNINRQVSKVIKKYEEINQIANKYPLLGLASSIYGDKNQIYSRELSLYANTIFQLDKKASK